MTTTAPDFHPRAASAALAKFVAESDEPSALELLAPLNPDQLRDLIRGERRACVRRLAHPVPASGGNDPPRHRAQHPER